MLWYWLRPNCALVLWWLIDVSLYLRAGFESPRLLRCIYVSHMHVFGGFNYLYDYDDYTKIFFGYISFGYMFFGYMFFGYMFFGYIQIKWHYF